MINKKSLLNGGCMLAVFMLGACSGDKMLPEGKRVSVLSPVAAVQPDITAKDEAVEIPALMTNSSWQQTGYNDRHLVPNLKADTAFNTVWSVNFGEGSSKREFLISSPVISGDYIFTLDAEALLTAFNRKTGDTLWELELKPENKRTDETALKGVGLAVSGKVVYAVTGFGDIFAVDMEKGTQLWRHSLNLPLRISPTVAENAIFVQSVDNKFFALDIKDGSELWNYDISMENTTLVGGAPAVYAPDLNVVVTGFSNGELQAFNAAFGTPLWSDVLISNRQAYSSTFLNTVKAAPAADGETLYAVGNANVLTAIDIRTGSRIWEKEIGSVNMPLVAGNMVYVVSNSNELIALSKKNGDIIWAVPVDLGEKPNDVTVFAPLMLDSRIIVTLSSGKVYAYMPQTGKLMSAVNLDEELNTALVAAGGYVYFTTRDADLIACK